LLPLSESARRDRSKSGGKPPHSKALRAPGTKKASRFTRLAFFSLRKVSYRNRRSDFGAAAGRDGALGRPLDGRPEPGLAPDAERGPLLRGAALRG
jgi:hypothetical protein